MKYLSIYGNKSKHKSDKLRVFMLELYTSLSYSWPRIVSAVKKNAIYRRVSGR